MHLQMLQALRKFISTLLPSPITEPCDSDQVMGTGAGTRDRILESSLRHGEGLWSVSQPPSYTHPPFPVWCELSLPSPITSSPDVIPVHSKFRSVFTDHVLQARGWSGLWGAPLPVVLPERLALGVSGGGVGHGSWVLLSASPRDSESIQ